MYFQITYIIEFQIHIIIRDRCEVFKITTLTIFRGRYRAEFEYFLRTKIGIGEWII